MKFRLYKKEIKHIESMISRFHWKSVVCEGVSYLQDESCSDRYRLEKMPWIALYIIKLAALSKVDSRLTISRSDFINILNEAYKLQDTAADLSSGDFYLKTRAMAYQQAWYQVDYLTYISGLARQSHLFLSDNSFYATAFKKESGVALGSFFIIANFIIISIMESRSRLSIPALIHAFYPTIHSDELCSFLRLTSVCIDDLPDFLESSRLLGYPESEYFQLSPFRDKPLLIMGDELIVIDKKLCAGGLSSFVPRYLRKTIKERFKENFGVDMESYISKLLVDAKLRFSNENEIKDLLRENNCFIKASKTADFLVYGENPIILESKAIEPSDIVLSTADGSTLKSNLRQSFLKAIEQGQETAVNLARITAYKNSVFRLIVVVHEDFWISNGDSVLESIDSELEDFLFEKYDCIPISFNNIIYISLGDLESIIHAHKKGHIVFDVFLKECMDSLIDPSMRRLTSSHLISENLKSRFFRHEFVTDKHKSISQELREIINKNAAFWDGKVYKFCCLCNNLLETINKIR